MFEERLEPPEDKAVTHCAYCGCEIFEGDALYTIDGGICEECLNDNYLKLVSLEDFHEF